MADDAPLFDFTSGGAAAEEFKKKEDAARAAARGNTQFLSSILKDDSDTEILRFLFESEPFGQDRSRPVGADNPQDPATGWIWTKQHVMAKTKGYPKDTPEDKKKNWPEKVTAICRRTPLGPNQTPAFPECYIDTQKNDRGWPERPQLYLWAGAVLRDELIGTQELVDEGRIDASQIGKRVIIDKQDLVDELDKDGNTTGRKVWKKRYVIVNQRVDNFFSTLITAGQYHGTILDRDYRITRKGGKGEKHTFAINSLDPYEVTVLRDDKPVVIKYDLREPEIAALYTDSGVDRAALIKMVSRKISDDFYNRFFDPRVEVSWKDGFDDDARDDGPNSAPPPPPAPTQAQQEGKSTTQEPTAGPTAEALAAMRDKVMNGNNAAPTAAPAQDGGEQQSAASEAAPAAAPPLLGKS